MNIILRITANALHLLTNLYHSATTNVGHNMNLFIAASIITTVIFWVFFAVREGVKLARTL